MTDIHDRHEGLLVAATCLYMAGHWSCDREVQEEALWSALRDSLYLPCGLAPVPVREDETELTENLND